MFTHCVCHNVCCRMCVISGLVLNNMLADSVCVGDIPRLCVQCAVVGVCHSLSSVFLVAGLVGFFFVFFVSSAKSNQLCQSVVRLTV